MPMAETRLRTAGHDGGVRVLTRVITGDDPSAWAAAGFAVAGDEVRLGPVTIVCDGAGGGPRELAYGDPPADPAPPHPNGAGAIDHIVLFTDSIDDSVAANAVDGWEERRRAEPPAVPLPMAFLRLGDAILEVAQTGVTPPRLWGLTVVTEDLEATAALLGDRLGSVRDAVQPGRRIATLRSAPGLDTALAFITPRSIRARTR